MPKVSVIIPTHNRARLLKRAVASVLAQDFTDFELIIIDDSSEEDAREVVEAFKDARIRYLRHGSMKASAARNMGIGEAGGEYVAFLDDDDEWYPTKLSKQLSVFRRGGGRVALVYTGLRYINEAKGFYRTIMPAYRSSVFEKLLEVGFVRTLSLVMIRKDVLVEVKGFDTTMPALHDWDLYLRIAKRYEFDYVPEVLVNYYVSYDGIMHDLEKQLSGQSIFYAKYADQIKPMALSNYYLFRGVTLYYHGDIVEGRRCLVKSLQINWRNLKAIPIIGLSMMGSTIFKKIYSILQETVFALFFIRVSEIEG